MRPVYRDDHEMFREMVRKFIENEIVPFHDQWEKDGVVPHELWLKAGENGLLCVTAPEEYGGPGGDFGHSAVLIEELARVNATAVGFTTHSEIAVPYILAYGTEEQKKYWIPKMVSGEKICALALTEPGTGSDLRSMRTTAKPDGDGYRISGQKTFITNGVNSGVAVLAAKLEPTPTGKEITLFVVDADKDGFSKGRKLEKIGLKGQDTSELFFDDVRVEASDMLGPAQGGFKLLTHQLAKERLIIAIRAAESVNAMLDETLEYVRDRKAFGKTVFDFQNTRFTLAEVKAKATMLRSFVDDCLGQLLRGDLTPEVAAMAKLLGAEIQGELLDKMLQLHGGYGFMSEYRVSRAWVDARVARIYGGTSEIMKEIIARSL